MAKLGGQIVPETQAEWNLLQDLYAVTGEAKKTGVDDATILMMLNFAAVSIAGQGALGDPVDVPIEGSDRTEACPECDTEIENVVWQMGGTVYVRPCGHEVDGSEIEGWVDDV